MKFTISRLEFLDLLNRVQGVVGPRPSFPILLNVLIEAAHDELVLTATDLTVGIRCYAEARVLEEGKTAVPLKKLVQLVRELTSTNLEISSHNHVMEIVADSAIFKLPGVSSQDFPSLPTFDEAIQFAIPQPTLKKLFLQTAFAAAKDDTRLVLNGVLMQIANSVATFVATDARRLSRAHVGLELTPEHTGAYSVPLKAIEEFTRNLTEDPDDVATVNLLQDRIGVTANHVTVVTKLLQGEFPDYGQLIPETCETVLRLHREELVSLLRQISLFTTEKSPSARFTFENAELTLTKNSLEGEGKVSMPVDYKGAKIEIAFIPNAFLEILRHCHQEVINLGLIDGFNPAVITDHHDQNSSSQPTPLYVLMPLRLSEV